MPQSAAGAASLLRAAGFGATPALSVSSAGAAR